MTNTVTPCPVCDGSAETFPTSMDAKQFECPRCGRFIITGTALATLSADKSLMPRAGAILSYAIRKMMGRDARPIPTLTSELMKRLLETTTLPSPREQADNLILWLGDAHRTNQVGEPIPIKAETLIAVCGGVGVRDIHYVARQLKDSGLLDDKSTMGSTNLHLTFAGWDRYEEIQRAHSEGPIAFMAMPFGNELLDTTFAKYFKPAVALTGFDLRRLDERPAAGLIDNRMRVEIRKAKFLLADLTGGNPGAYWEAGFAEGLGKPVIFTCHSDWFNEKRKTHFDTNHHQTVVWHESNMAKALDELRVTIRATLPADAKMAD